MEKEEDLSKKLNVLETNYRKEKQQIEETIEDVHQENRVFRRGIESLADYVRHMAKMKKLLNQKHCNKPIDSFRKHKKKVK